MNRLFRVGAVVPIFGQNHMIVVIRSIFELIDRTRMFSRKIHPSDNVLILHILSVNRVFVKHIIWHIKFGVDMLIFFQIVSIDKFHILNIGHLECSHFVSTTFQTVKRAWNSFNIKCFFKKFIFMDLNVSDTDFGGKFISNNL